MLLCIAWGWVHTKCSLLFFCHFGAWLKQALSVFSTAECQRDHVVLGVHLHWKASCRKYFRKHFLLGSFFLQVNLFAAKIRRERQHWKWAGVSLLRLIPQSILDRKKKHCKNNNIKNPNVAPSSSHIMETWSVFILTVDYNWWSRNLITRLFSRLLYYPGRAKILISS